MTRGRRALLAVLLRTKQRLVAATVGVTRPEVSKWASGARKPDDRARAAIFRAYGIRPDSWDERELSRVHGRY